MKHLTRIILSAIFIFSVAGCDIEYLKKLDERCFREDKHITDEAVYECYKVAKPDAYLSNCVREHSAMSWHVREHVMSCELCRDRIRKVQQENGIYDKYTDSTDSDDDDDGNIYTNPVEGQLYNQMGGLGGLW